VKDGAAPRSRFALASCGDNLTFVGLAEANEGMQKAAKMQSIKMKRMILMRLPLTDLDTEGEEEAGRRRYRTRVKDMPDR
jgi:hypothetical protein